MTTNDTTGTVPTLASCTLIFTACLSSKLDELTNLYNSFYSKATSAVHIILICEAFLNSNTAARFSPGSRSGSCTALYIDILWMTRGVNRYFHPRVQQSAGSQRIVEQNKYILILISLLEKCGRSMWVAMHRLLIIYFITWLDIVQEV